MIFSPCSLTSSQDQAIEYAMTIPVLSLVTCSVPRSISKRPFEATIRHLTTELFRSILAGDIRLPKWGQLS